MGRRIKKLKRIRIHREGTDTLIYSAMALIAIGIILWRSFDSHIPFGIFILIFGTIWCIVLNFFRCPIRLFGTEDTENLIVAPADGKVVVIEKVFEDKYFKEERIMVSIFMSLFNVHANWFPVDGIVKKVEHQDGHFHKAWLPKASDENEMTNVIITTQVDTGEKTADGQPVTKDVDILCRQVAGAVARRIVTYAKENEHCYIDEHMGFIKFGSRVDLFLPVGTEIKVAMDQSTTGNQTVIGILK
jgi:phosphatidylserine decarboxylase